MSAGEALLFGPETSVLKVGGKIALTPLEARPLTVSPKCEPSLAEPRASSSLEQPPTPYP